MLREDPAHLGALALNLAELACGRVLGAVRDLDLLANLDIVEDRDRRANGHALALMDEQLPDARVDLGGDEPRVARHEIAKANLEYLTGHLLGRYGVAITTR